MRQVPPIPLGDAGVAIRTTVVATIIAHAYSFPSAPQLVADW
jgi:hypothetical protein